MQIVSFVAIKGGVGKTLLSFNLAGYLAARKKRVLLIDLDFQNNLSSKFGITNEKGDVANLFRGDNVDETSKIQDQVKPKKVKNNIYLISGNRYLEDYTDKQIANPKKNEFLFLWALNHMDDLQSKYDYIIFDCRPDFNLATKNAVLVSDVLLSPVDTSVDSQAEANSDLEDRIKGLSKQETDVFTKKSLVDVKLGYIANNFRVNNHLTSELFDYIKKSKRNFIARIPNRAILGTTMADSLSFSEMEALINIPDADFDKFNKGKDNEELAKKRNYYKTKRNQFRGLDDKFEQIVKFIDQK